MFESLARSEQRAQVVGGGSHLAGQALGKPQLCSSEPTPRSHWNLRGSVSVYWGKTATLPWRPLALNQDWTCLTCGSRWPERRDILFLLLDISSHQGIMRMPLLDEFTTSSGLSADEAKAK